MFEEDQEEVYAPYQVRFYRCGVTFPDFTIHFRRIGAEIMDTSQSCHNL